MKTFRQLLKLMLGLILINAIASILALTEPECISWWIPITSITWSLYVISDKEPFKD